MRVIRFRRVLVVSIIVLLSILSGVFLSSRSLWAQTLTLYWGSSGPDVTRVQSRLSDWGFYTGPVDGDFSGGTAEAIKRFQANSGLAVDGVVGPSTWEAMGYSVTTAATYQPSRGVSGRDDIMLLARLVSGEAEGEPYLGRVAVAAVILNRVNSDQFPNSIAGVIYQPDAFESITNGIANGAPSDESVRAAQDAMNGWDPSQGALFFWNPSKPVSSWIWSRAIITEIGAHVFAK